MKYIILLVMDLKSDVFFEIYLGPLTKFGIMVLFIIKAKWVSWYIQRGRMNVEAGVPQG